MFACIYCCVVMFQVCSTGDDVLWCFRCAVLVMLCCDVSGVQYWWCCVVMFQVCSTGDVVLWCFRCAVLVMLCCDVSGVQYWWCCVVMFQVCSTGDVVLWCFRCAVLAVRQREWSGVHWRLRRRLVSSSDLWRFSRRVWTTGHCILRPERCSHLLLQGLTGNSC